MTVAEMSVVPKLTPRKLIGVPPDVGWLLGSKLVKVGASYEKSESLVPTTAATVTCIVSFETGAPDGASHIRFVAEVHAVVAQNVTPSTTV